MSEQRRVVCVTCGKTVSTPIPMDLVFRAVAVCPECIEQHKVTFPTDTDGCEKPHVGEEIARLQMARDAAEAWAREQALEERDLRAAIARLTAEVAHVKMERDALMAQVPSDDPNSPGRAAGAAAGGRMITGVMRDTVSYGAKRQ